MFYQKSKQFSFSSGTSTATWRWRLPIGALSLAKLVGRVVVFYSSGTAFESLQIYCLWTVAKWVKISLRLFGNYHFLSFRRMVLYSIANFVWMEISILNLYKGLYNSIDFLEESKISGLFFSFLTHREKKIEPSRTPQSCLSTLKKIKRISRGVWTFCLCVQRVHTSRVTQGLMPYEIYSKLGSQT